MHGKKWGTIKNHYTDTTYNNYIMNGRLKE